MVNSKMRHFTRRYGSLVWASREPYPNDEKNPNGGNEQKIENHESNDEKNTNGGDESGKGEDHKPQTIRIKLFEAVYVNEEKDRIVWCDSDGELRGIDFGVFHKSFLHAHIIFDEEDAGLFVRRTVNWQLIKQQLTQFVCFVFLLSFLGWKLFALIFWKACVFYWVHHSPYPTRIRQVQYFLGEVGTLVKLVVMGSISFQASVKLFQVAFAQFIQEIKSKELLNPQALSFLQVLGLTIRSYSIAAGFPLLKTIYIPLFAMFGIGLWFDLRNHKFRIPIMISFSYYPGNFYICGIRKVRLL